MQPAGREWQAFTPAELERLGGRAVGTTAFHRAELRRTSRRRRLDCGHTIDAREPYRYSVAKINGVAELLQVAECDFCMRSGCHY